MMSLAQELRRLAPCCDIPADLDALLSPEQAGEVLRLGVPSLKVYRSIGRLPASVRMGRRVYYRLRDLLAYKERVQQ